MKAAPFEFVRAKSMDEVFAAFESHGDDALILAGGQSMMPMLNMRLASPKVLVDINHIANWRACRLMVALCGSAP